MLKAYNYVENAQVGSDVHNFSIFNEEKKIIAKFVQQNPSDNKKKCICPACSSKLYTDFAVINGVIYIRCINCCSIFLNVDDDLILKYKSYAPLVEYRQSGDYQKQAIASRLKIWRELCFWIEFRCRRYLEKSAYGLSVLDISNKYTGLSKMISVMDICSNFEKADIKNAKMPADLVLYTNQLQCDANPLKTLNALKDLINPNGLLIANTRNGSGFDILTLKGQIDTVFPYEHCFLPTLDGLKILFQKAGFELLEITTPGALDIRYVINNKDKLPQDDLFMRYLCDKSDQYVLAEFQRFLQKSGMSSYTQIVARRK